MRSLALDITGASRATSSPQSQRRTSGSGVSSQAAASASEANSPSCTASGAKAAAIFWALGWGCAVVMPPERQTARLEPPLSQGTGQHSQHVPPAGLKPGQGQVIRVAAKSCNVLPHPIQRLGNIQQRKIPGSIRTGAKSGETVEPQQSQAVVYRHHHTFRPLHQAVTTQLLGRASLVAAAVEKDQYRPAPGAGCGIDVQPQAVLHTGQTAAVLTGFRPRAGAVPHCRPGHRVQRSLPAALAARRFAIRDAVKCKAALLLLAQDRAILGLDLGGDP